MLLTLTSFFLPKRFGERALASSNCKQFRQGHWSPITTSQGWHTNASLEGVCWWCSNPKTNFYSVPVCNFWVLILELKLGDQKRGDSLPCGCLAEMRSPAAGLAPPGSDSQGQAKIALQNGRIWIWYLTRRFWKSKASNKLCILERRCQKLGSYQIQQERTEVSPAEEAERLGAFGWWRQQRSVWSIKSFGRNFEWSEELWRLWWVGFLMVSAPKDEAGPWKAKVRSRETPCWHSRVGGPLRLCAILFWQSATSIAVELFLHDFFIFFLL